ncbi:hypothetical protein G7068_06385 [Leucobacter viscericola]|uniref:Uncharacterized protein n=1 Tax=Leucobacter viscericola TaxID=2714935 RepID=A0A6G7XE74_9MICO|nr:hypothetical protein [Leucobacter viscericola]QIK62865.1 hypothetical protein G7068_06385 [Leucobacter viscericola]
MSENRTAKLARVVPEIGIAILAGGLSWLLTPPSGLVMHWSVEGKSGWVMTASTNAVVAAAVVFVLGYVITTFASFKIGMRYPLPGPAAAATLWVAFTGLQRSGVEMASFPIAVAAAAVVYFLVFWFSMRRSVPTEGSLGTEP